MCSLAAADLYCSAEPRAKILFLLSQWWLFRKITALYFWRGWRGTKTGKYCKVWGSSLKTNHVWWFILNFKNDDTSPLGTTPHHTVLEPHALEAAFRIFYLLTDFIFSSWGDLKLPPGCRTPAKEADVGGRHTEVFISVYLFVFLRPTTFCALGSRGKMVL